MTVDVATAQLSTSEGIATCLFKIAFEDDSASYMWSDSPPLPLDALKTISCLTCEQPLLTSSSTIDDVDMLPSEHWTDMRDIWTCACTASLLAKKLPRSLVIRASPHRAQLASSYIQLHSLDVDHTALTIDHAEPHTVAFHRNWKTLWCVRCGSSVGQAEMPNAETINENRILPANGKIEQGEASSRETISDGSHSAHSQEHSVPLNNEDSEINKILFRNVRLHKHATKTCGGVSLFESHNLETKISADILAAIGVTGVFKLVFRDYRTRQPLLAVTVLGWDSLVFSSAGASVLEFAGPRSASPAIRLTYSKISGESPIDPLTPSEIIESDCFTIEVLATLLDSRHASLPSTIAHLGSQPISFLHYLPPEE